MEEVYSKILKIEFTRDNGKMTSNKVMAFKFFKINLNMKDSLKMVWKMAKENIIGVMVLFTKDNGKIIKSKA
jgi:hypothetical protein